MMLRKSAFSWSLLAFVAVLVAAGDVSAQQPTHQNVPYDDQHPSQCLDVYVAKADAPTPAMVYIHGGGWRAGSKIAFPGGSDRSLRPGSFQSSPSNIASQTSHRIRRR
jgi:hypothetical protein